MRTVQYGNQRSRLTRLNEVRGQRQSQLLAMCGDNPNLLPEVNSAITTSYVALAFACTTFIAMTIVPLGTASGFVGVFGVVGGSILCCCGPPYRAGQMQAAGALFIVGAAAHLLQLSLLIAAFVLWFPKCDRGRDSDCGWQLHDLPYGVACNLRARCSDHREFRRLSVLCGEEGALRVGSDPPSGERTSTQWQRISSIAVPPPVAEATVVADCAPVQTVVGIPARPPPTRASSLPALTGMSATERCEACMRSVVARTMYITCATLYVEYTRNVQVVENGHAARVAAAASGDPSSLSSRSPSRACSSAGSAVATMRRPVRGRR